jgi:ribonuclease D
MPRPAPDVAPEITKRDLTEAQLQAHLASPALAVDTETMGLNLQRDRLCVVQLCDAAGRASMVQIEPEQLALPLAERAPRLRRLLEDPRVLKVMHFARFDVAAVRKYLGVELAPLYCTRTVSKLVRTYTDRHGLKDNLLELLDVELDKVTRHTDWSSPELSKEQVRYAISDVTLLIPLMEKLNVMLERSGRRALAEECFQAIPTLAKLDLLEFDLLFEH